MPRYLLASLLFAFTIGPVSAQDAQKQPEKIAPPKVVQPEKFPPTPQSVQPAPIIIEPYVLRSGSRDVWQHYGVNNMGRFVPRVIALPLNQGGYYSRDLTPFPWVQNQRTAVMPYVVD